MTAQCFARRLGAVSAVMAAWTLATAARAGVPATIVTLIDFESVANVEPAPSFLQLSSVPLASYLSDQLLGDYGVRFFSETPNPAAVAYVRLGNGHAASGEYGVGSIDTESRLNYQIPLMASFFLPGDTSVPAVTDIVSIGWDRASCCETITLEAYDRFGDLIATASTTPDPGNLLTLTQPGIHTVRVLEQSGTVAWDDLAFGELSAVPEPSTFGMTAVFAGLGLLALRCRAVRS